MDMDVTQRSAYRFKLMILILLMMTLFMFFAVRGIREEIFNGLNVSTIAKDDLQDCKNARIQKEIKERFEQSPYAMSNQLTVVHLNSEKYQQSRDAVQSCLSTITLNNQQKVTYLINFIQQENDFLVESRSWASQ